jgi:HD-GYP domain-containing protein (c-di-GMP phosphodiesterase class II)
VNSNACLTQPEAPSLQQCFALLCSHWRGLGIWLSLWDAQGHCLEYDRTTAGPFRVLTEQSPPFHAWLADLCRQAREGPGTLSRGEMAGLSGFAVPMVNRDVVEHVVVAALVPQGFQPGEPLLHLCRQAPLDPCVVTRLAKDVAWHDPRAIAGLEELLTLLVDHLVRNETVTPDMQQLAANLAQTYEVLNLIYHVSDKFDNRQRPDEFFERTFAEVLAVLQVESLAAVTHSASRMGEPTVIVVGKGQAHRQQIHAIAEGLSSLMLDRRILLLDHASVERFLPQEQWLSNLVAVWLLHEDEPVGALLAINKANGKDFDDIDLQMLQVLADRCSMYLQDLNILADLQDLLIALLRSLVNSIDAMDPYTSGHSERVALISRRLAEHMRSDPAFCQRAYFGGLLHDVGKIAIPGAILRKPGRLDSAEFAMVRQHPANGARLIEHIDAMHDILPAILGHHERMDGKGYPTGKTAAELDPLARLVAVADCFDAMTRQRAYRGAKPLKQACAELQAIAGKQLDADMVQALLTMDLAQLQKELDTYHSGLRTETAPTHR